VTAEELLGRAAACRTCGEAHAYRWTDHNRASWEHDDGHSNLPYIDIGIIARLDYLVTGTYTDPWAYPRPRQEAS